MMASLLAMFYLVLEMLLRPFQQLQQKAVYHEDDDDVASVCTEATTETAESSSMNTNECNTCGVAEAEDDDDSQHSIMAKQVARASLSDRKLVLDNFIANSSPRDTLDLCKLLQRHHQDHNTNNNNKSRRRQQSSSLRSIVFRDTVHGAGYRRWLFKKTGVYRHVLNVGRQLGIEVHFDATVAICADCMSPKAIVSLLDALKVDSDVKSVTFTGSLHYRDAITIVNVGLKNLLQADYRHWQTVSLQDLELIASTPKEALLARKSCQRSLQKVAAHRYIIVQI